MADVIDFGNRSKAKTEDTAPVIKEGTFEFYIHSEDTEPKGSLVQATGYLKFGPAFIAVVDTPEDTSNVLFAIQTNLVKYVKRISDEGHIEGTLSV